MRVSAAAAAGGGRMGSGGIYRARLSTRAPLINGDACAPLSTEAHRELIASVCFGLFVVARSPRRPVFQMATVGGAFGVLLLLAVAAVSVGAPADEGTHMKPDVTTEAVEAAASKGQQMDDAGHTTAKQSALSSTTEAPGDSEADKATESPEAGVEAAVDPLEEPCARAGGVCLREADCPAGQLSAVRGLCPAQRMRGVECCHGLSVQERRCSARGGVCRPKHKCGRSLWEEHADDCQSHETCCVLVK